MPVRTLILRCIDQDLDERKCLVLFREAGIIEKTAKGYFEGNGIAFPVKHHYDDLHPSPDRKEYLQKLSLGVDSD